MSIVSGHGTKVILKEDGSVFVATSDQKYESKPGDTELKGVRSLDISSRPDEIVTANADICVSFVGSIIIHDSDYKLYAELPEHNWKPKRIRKMVFEDGSIWKDESQYVE